MATYEVHFDGTSKEVFEDRDQALQWAQEVADTGHIVDVVLKRRFWPPKFLTAFPESEREAREAAWRIPLSSIIGTNYFAGGAGGSC